MAACEGVQGAPTKPPNELLFLATAEQGLAVYEASDGSLVSHLPPGAFDATLTQGGDLGRPTWPVTTAGCTGCGQVGPCGWTGSPTSAAPRHSRRCWCRRPASRPSWAPAPCWWSRAPTAA